MNKKVKNNIEKSERKSTKTESNKSFKDKLVVFLKNNKAASILALLLLIVFIWGQVKIQINGKIFNNEKTQLINQHNSTIDSLKINHIYFATEVFSWSVRSELLRNNTENLNQLLTIFVKGSGANLVQLINPENKIVLLSSNKKYEGNQYLEDLNFELEKSIVLSKDGNIRIFTQVMGFNNPIGILIVEFKN